MNKLTSIHIYVLFIHSQNSFHLCSIRLNWFFIMFSYAFLKSPCTLFIVHRKQTTTKDTTTLNMTHWHRISSSRKSVCLKRAIFMTNCEGYQSYSADCIHAACMCDIIVNLELSLTLTGSSGTYVSLSARRRLSRIQSCRLFICLKFLWKVNCLIVKKYL